MTSGFAVGQVRCQSKPSRVEWSNDPELANLVPSFDPDEEETGMNNVHCAAKCSSYTWCSSFFFQISGRCLMFRTVFFAKKKLVDSKGTEYYRTNSGETGWVCSSRRLIMYPLLTVLTGKTGRLKKQTGIKSDGFGSSEVVCSMLPGLFNKFSES